MFRKFKVVAVLGGKGGVGKTLVSCALAHNLSKHVPVTVLDLDLHGPNVLTQFGFPPTPAQLNGWHVVPPRFRPNLAVYGADQQGDTKGLGFLADDGTKKLWVVDAFDSIDFADSRYVICDLPAGTDEIFVQAVQGAPVDAYVLVTNPDAPALQDASKVVRLLENFGLKRRVVGVVENKARFVCPSCGTSRTIENGHGGAREALCERFDLPYLGGIPYLWEPAPAILDDPFFQGLTERLLLARFKQRRARHGQGD